MLLSCTCVFLPAWCTFSAAAAGVQTLFIVGGIHAGELQLVGGAADPNAACSWNQAALDTLCAQHGVVPTYCMPFLQP